MRTASDFTLSNQTSNGGSPASRTVNSQNEATVVAGNTLVYNDNGNTTTDDQGHTLIYDAWNKQVEVKNGGTVLTSYSFDAQGRRIIEDPGTATDLYFSSAGQVLEERQGSTVTAQNVWGLGYVNDLVLRDSYSAGGGLDSTYGTGGEVTSGLADSSEGLQVQIQPDGKTVVLGLKTGGSFVARYDTDGTLDSSFGSSGVVTISSETLSGLTLQSDGKIIAVGYSSGSFNFDIYRFNSDGSADSGFGSSGKAVVDFGGFDRPGNVVVQPDGKILVSGVTFGSEFDWALARLNSDGSADSSFGSGGQVVFDPDGSGGIAGSMLLQSTGKIVVIGTYNSGSDTGGAIVRFNSDGSIDDSFGADADGIVLLDIGDFDHGVAIQSLGDDRLVVAGTESGDVILHRYSADGILDDSFGSSGTVSTDVGATDGAAGVLVQPDGKIVVAGASLGTYPASDGVAARYNVDGSVDESFGTDGVVLEDFGSSAEFFGVALQKDGQIVAVGSSGDDVALARFDGGTTRLYAQQDADYNVTSVVDVSGNVKEHFIYTPYGVMSVLTAAYANTSDSYGWQYTFQGMRYDPATGLLHAFNREYFPTLGTWAQKDPWGYINGLDMYQFVMSNPVGLTDPSGLAAPGPFGGAAKNWNPNQVAPTPAPGYYVMIPVIGPMWQGMYDFENGDYVGYAEGPFLAALDLTGIGEEIEAVRAARAAEKAAAEAARAADAAKAAEAAKDAKPCQVPTCFVAGTLVLVSEPGSDVIVASSDRAGLITSSNRPDSLNDDERQYLGLSLIAVGIYGAVIAQRVRRHAWLKRARQEQAGIEPLEFPLWPTRLRRLTSRSSIAVRATLPFCTTAIC